MLSEDLGYLERLDGWNQFCRLSRSNRLMGRLGANVARSVLSLKATEKFPSVYRLQPDPIASNCPQHPSVLESFLDHLRFRVGWNQRTVGG